MPTAIGAVRLGQIDGRDRSCLDMAVTTFQVVAGGLNDDDFRQKTLVACSCRCDISVPQLS